VCRSSTLATGSVDGTVRLWDIDAGRGRKFSPHNGAPVHSVSFPSPTGLITSGHGGAEISAWDAQTLDLVNTVKLGCVCLVLFIYFLDLY
jgi:WD40 repeat protein